MHSVHVKSIVFLVVSAGVVSFVSAAPKIAIDSTRVTVDTVVQGETSRIRHVFTVRNTGDSPLRVDKVRSSCGCMAVEVDSVIPPGREGSVTAEIVTKELYDGNFTKDITVLSNAVNRPQLRLYISGYFKTVLEVEERSSIRLSPGKQSDTGVVVRLHTSKRCVVKKVEFKYTETELGMQWETAVPIRFTYEYADEKESSGDKQRFADKQNLCLIRLFYSPGPSEDKWGKFFITTDLKTEKEIFVPGTLVGKP